MKYEIKVEQWFDRSAQDVWAAITEHGQMVQWFFDTIPDFEPVTGFETVFDVMSNDRVFRHLWRIESVETGKKIGYNWRYEGIVGEGHVTFELTEENNKTKLCVTNTGLESFPNTIAEFKPESCRVGWEYFIQDRLVNYLQKDNL